MSYLSILLLLSPENFRIFILWDNVHTISKLVQQQLLMLHYCYYRTTATISKIWSAFFYISDSSINLVPSLPLDIPVWRGSASLRRRPSICRTDEIAFLLLLANCRLAPFPWSNFSSNIGEINDTKFWCRFFLCFRVFIRKIQQKKTFSWKYKNCAFSRFILELL